MDIPVIVNTSRAMPESLSQIVPRCGAANRPSDPPQGATSRLHEFQNRFTLKGRSPAMSMQAIWIGIVLAALTLVHPVSAQGQNLGKNDFEQFCSECHGATGKGDGSKAKALGRKSADLTRLSEKKWGRVSCSAGLQRDRWQSRGVDSRAKGHAGMGSDLYRKIEGTGAPGISAGNEVPTGP